VGRPTVFTQEVADAICDRLPAEPLTEILADEGMPGYRTVMRWLRANPEFRQNYAHAREDQGDHDADKVAEIRAMLLRGEIEPDVARVAMDSCKWTAARRRPKVYGDKLELAGNAEQPLTVVVRKFSAGD
jgi:hypothetical protein